MEEINDNDLKQKIEDRKKELELEQCKKQVKNAYNYEEVLANAVNQESEQEGA